MNSSLPGSTVEWRHSDASCLAATQAQAVVTESDLHRLAQRCEADDLNFFSFQDAHLHEPLDQAVVAVNSRNPATLTGSELVERRRHGRAFPSE
jgi:hypothetical protein